MVPFARGQLRCAGKLHDQEGIFDVFVNSVTRVLGTLNARVLMGFFKVFSHSRGVISPALFARLRLGTQTVHYRAQSSARPSAFNPVRRAMLPSVTAAA